MSQGSQGSWAAVSIPQPGFIELIVGKPALFDACDSALRLTGGIMIRLTEDASMASKIGAPSKSPLTFHPQPHQLRLIKDLKVEAQWEGLSRAHAGHENVSMVAYSDLRAWISALHVQQSRGSIPAGTPTPVLPIPDPVLENALEAAKRG